MIFLDQIPMLDIRQFYDPEYYLEIRGKLKGNFLLETGNGERWHELDFAKIEDSPYSRARLFFVCPGCGARAKYLFLGEQLRCRRCLGHYDLSTGYEDDGFYRKVIKPVQEVMRLEARMKRRIPATKKEQMEKKAVVLTREIVDQTIEEWEQWLRSLWETWLAEFTRHQQRAECWKEINKEWDEFMALGPDTDQDKQIMAMKSIARKIKIMGEI